MDSPLLHPRRIVKEYQESTVVEQHGENHRRRIQCVGWMWDELEPTPTPKVKDSFSNRTAPWALFISGHALPALIEILGCPLIPRTGTQVRPLRGVGSLAGHITGVPFRRDEIWQVQVCLIKGKAASETVCKQLKQNKPKLSMPPPLQPQEHIANH